MAKTKKAPAAPTPPTSFELLGMRVQKIINSPAAQKLKSATVSKLPGESADDWEGVLELFGELDNVTLEFLDDGNVEISWVKPEED